jgi:hypothetical protein
MYKQLKINNILNNYMTIKKINTKMNQKNKK